MLDSVFLVLSIKTPNISCSFPLNKIRTRSFVVAHVTQNSTLRCTERNASGKRYRRELEKDKCMLRVSAECK